MIELKKITLLSDNMKECIALDIASEKKDFVYSNAFMLAWAYNNTARNEPMECRAIYVGDKMVGLICYQRYVDNLDDPYYNGETIYFIRPFMVDKNHLNKGYEEEAIKQLAEEIRTKPLGDATAIFASFNEKVADMAGSYKAAGFTKTHMDWANEDPNNIKTVMRMSL
jgi:hypothetical protein